MTRTFAVTFDYLCPFARNAFEAIAAGLEEGREWEVRSIPFSLSQAHVPEGETAAWDREPGEKYTSGVLALQWGIAVRDRFSEAFMRFHLGAFAARHDEGLNIKDETVLKKIAVSAGLDPEAVAAIVASGEPCRTLSAEHTEAVDRWRVFGVPTFIENDQAVFVRLMERGRVDDLEQVLGMISSTSLNEFKRTNIPR